MTDEKIVSLWLHSNHWDITGFNRTITDLRTFTEAVTKADREGIALMVEQMGIEGYGTLAIAAAIRKGETSAQPLAEPSSPAAIRKKANSPWSDPGY